MKKKSKKKITIIVVIALVIVGIGIGAGFVYLKTSDQMVNYVLTDFLEAEVAKGLGETIGDEVVISDPKVLENLGLALPSMGQGAGNVAGTNGTTDKAETSGTSSSKEESNGSNDQGQKETPQVSEPVKVSKKELAQAIEKKVESVTSQVPTSDKTNMTNLVLKYIDKSDISYLTGLMLDGVSAEDLAAAKKIAKESFPEEAMDEVYDYYKKYAGLVANK